MIIYEPFARLSVVFSPRRTVFKDPRGSSQGSSTNEATTQTIM